MYCLYDVKEENLLVEIVGIYATSSTHIIIHSTYMRKEKFRFHVRERNNLPENPGKPPPMGPPAPPNFFANFSIILRTLGLF